MEFADVIVLTKGDLAGADQADHVEGVGRGLNPLAKVVRAEQGRVDLADVLDTGLFDMDTAQSSAAWIAELNGVHTPETEEYGIGHFVYRARRPFHPARLMEHIRHGEWGGVIRSKGFFWLASRPRWVYVWSQAGGACSFEVTGQWWAAVSPDERPDDADHLRLIGGIWEEPYGDRRQEIVLIGQAMDRHAITAALDACLLTDAELAAGPDGWHDMDDPFPTPTPARPAHEHEHATIADDR